MRRGEAKLWRCDPSVFTAFCFFAVTTGPGGFGDSMAQLNTRLMQPEDERFGYPQGWRGVKASVREMG
jgi:hypothetical protein